MNIRIFNLIQASVLLSFSIFIIGCEFSKESMTPGEVRIVLSEVSTIDINSHTSKFTMVNEEGSWSLRYDQKTVPADSQLIQKLIRLLNTMDFSIAVTDKSEEWKNYLVDQSGTRVTVKSPGQTDLDVMVGKFGMESANVFHTFVRPLGQDVVYSASQFMGINIGRTPENFRNKVVAQLDKKSLEAIVFNHPTDSFKLVKNSSGWFLENTEADELKLKNYLKELHVIIGVNFYDQPVPDSDLVSSIEFSTASSRTIISAYELADGSMVFNSTQNELNFFTDERLKNLFKSRSDFLP